MFCKFCDHSVDCIRVDMIKDHLKSKKHLKKKDLKEAGCSGSGIRQVSLTTITKSKDLRKEFVLDFIKMSTMADIPLEKVEKMRPFLLKYCKQAGTLPQVSTLRSQYIPRAYDLHFTALKQLLKDSTSALVDLIADETTDCRDKSILNVIATIKGKCYLIGNVCLGLKFRLIGYELSSLTVLHIVKKLTEKYCHLCFRRVPMCYALLI